MTRAALILAALLTLASATGQAMSIHTEVEMLAWSRDGKSALLVERSHGPEGGGSVRFRVVGGGKPTEVAYEVSNDLSKGAAPKQTLSESACRDVVDKLARTLTDRGFSGVTTKRDACAADREDAVDVDTAVARTLDESWLGKTNTIQSSLDGDKLVLKQHGKTLDTIPLGAPHDAVKAAMSPGTKLLVVIASERDGTSSLALIAGSASGRTDGFKPIPLGN